MIAAVHAQINGIAKYTAQYHISIVTTYLTAEHTSKNHQYNKKNQTDHQSDVIHLADPIVSTNVAKSFS